MLSTEVIVALVSSPVLVALIQLFQTAEFKMYSNTHENTLKVYEHMSKFRHMFGITRIIVFSYHNGGNFYSGSSHNKLTIEYESVGHQTTKLQPTIQSQSVSLLEDLPYHVEQNTVTFDMDIEHILYGQHPTRPMYYKVLNQYKIDHSMNVALYKKVFSFGDLFRFKNPWHLKMISTISINWEKGSRNWPLSIKSNQITRENFLVELETLANLLEPNRWKNPYKIQRFNKAVLG